MQDNSMSDCPKGQEAPSTQRALARLLLICQVQMSVSSWHYGLFFNVQAIFESCKCSCPCSFSSRPQRHPMSIMLETWLLFRQAISVEAAFSWAKPLNHSLRVPPLSLQGKCLTYQCLQDKACYLNNIVGKCIKQYERGVE